MLSQRHLARQICVQAIFAENFLSGMSMNFDFDLQISGLIKNSSKKIDDKTMRFLKNLYIGVKENLEAIDEKIQLHAPSFPIEKISKIDLTLLRLGTFELAFGEKLDIPKVVAINESIELAKEFGGEASGKFVNAVLNAIMKDESL